MECNSLQFSRHAFERMFSREIAPEVVHAVIRNGEEIAHYPDDRPYPSVLMLGFSEGQPIHVVVAKDFDDGVCHVVTVYRPDSGRWQSDFKARKKG